MVNILDRNIFRYQKLTEISLAVILQAKLIWFGSVFYVYNFPFCRVFLKAHLDLSLSRKELLSPSIPIAELKLFHCLQQLTTLVQRFGVRTGVQLRA